MYTEKQRSYILAEGDPNPFDEMSARITDLGRRLEEWNAWQAEYEKRSKRFNRFCSTVIKAILSLAMVGFLIFLSSCSRPVCDYKRLYRGSHSPKPKTHINPQPVPRGSMLGLMKGGAK